MIIACHFVGFGSIVVIVERGYLVVVVIVSHSIFGLSCACLEFGQHGFKNGGDCI